MANRFGDLEKQAIAILANGGNPATSQDKRLANYWAWKINPSSEAHNLPEGSERKTGRKTDRVFLEPFGVDLPSTLFAAVTISKRSFAAANGAILTALAYKALTAGTDSALPVKGFTPARVYWRTGEATTSAPRISRITKDPYSSFYAAGDEGFSAPFGRKAAETVLTRQKSLRAAIPASVGLVSFSPEKLRGKF